MIGGVVGWVTLDLGQVDLQVPLRTAFFEPSRVSRAFLFQAGQGRKRHRSDNYTNLFVIAHHGGTLVKSVFVIIHPAPAPWNLGGEGQKQSTDSYGGK